MRRVQTGMSSSKGGSHTTISAVSKGETVLMKHVHRLHYGATIIKHGGGSFNSN